MDRWLTRIESVLQWFPVIMMAVYLVLFAMAMNGNDWALRGWGAK